MKRFTLFACIAALFLVSSCDWDNNPEYNYFYPNAVVTVRNRIDGTVYLMLDDSTALKPTNIDKNPYGGREVRAFVNITDEGPYADQYSDIACERAVKVNWIDTILTKKTVVTAGEEDDIKYGTAPIEVIDNWVTVVEDGYITLCFSAVWGSGQNITHSVNLITGTNPDDPYELVLRHNANGDVIDHHGGIEKTGYVAFDLSTLRPDTLIAKEVKVKLKLKYLSFSGEKTITFDYYSGRYK